MEALYLVCGAHRPQLMRNPLGCAMNYLSLFLAFLVLVAEPLDAQHQNPAGPVRVTNQPKYQAPDGTVSHITRGQPATPLGAIHLCRLLVKLR